MKMKISRRFHIQVCLVPATRQSVHFPKVGFLMVPAGVAWFAFTGLATERTAGFRIDEFAAARR